LIKLRPDDDEVILLQIFIAILLFQEVAHHLVKFFNPRRRTTPLKLRPIFRGHRVDAGNSLELKVFNGVVMPVVSIHHSIEDYHCAYFSGLCIETFDSDLYRAISSNLRKFCPGEIPIIDFSVIQG
jgi:hypothetical protein